MQNGPLSGPPAGSSGGVASGGVDLLGVYGASPALSDPSDKGARHPVRGAFFLAVKLNCVTPDGKRVLRLLFVARKSGGAVWGRVSGGSLYSALSAAFAASPTTT